MAPKTKAECELLQDGVEEPTAPQDKRRKYEIVYPLVLIFLYVHLDGLYGLYLCFTTVKWATIIFEFMITLAAGIGTTAGAHRLWTHRTYKAKMPLQILLMVFSTIIYQRTLFKWIRNHRLHHKHSDTDADPHDARRGFFFSHIGWLLVKKHPEVLRKGKTIDMSDIYANPVLRFQDKYSIPFMWIVGFVLPTLIPVYFWDEDLLTSWHVTMARYAVSLNVIFLVNSAAHKWGYKPYDRHIKAVENKLVSLLAFGEGFHNYHHSYPWDYRTAELGNNYLNLATKSIDFFAWLGWAYDLRTVSEEEVKSKMLRTGDGSGDNDMGIEN